MKRAFGIVAIALTGFVVMQATAQESKVEKFGLYVAAADLNASRAFYERLFQKSPYVSNDNFVGFDVAGGLYAVFAAKAADRPIVKGNSAVPYIRVTNADAEFVRIKSLGTAMLDDKVVQEGPIKLFRFADPDGNVIEFFSLTAEPT